MTAVDRFLMRLLMMLLMLLRMLLLIWLLMRLLLLLLMWLLILGLSLLRYSLRPPPSSPLLAVSSLLPSAMDVAS